MLTYGQNTVPWGQIIRPVAKFVTNLVFEPGCGLNFGRAGPLGREYAFR